MNGQKNALELKSSMQAAEAILTQEFLIEYMEGELESSLDDDLELLLMNSVADRRALKSLESTKEILKAADDVCLPEDGRFYERMHASIMLGIAEELKELDGQRSHDFGLERDRMVMSINRLK